VAGPNADQRYVIVAQDKGTAGEIFRGKVKLAYERMPVSCAFNWTESSVHESPKLNVMLLARKYMATGISD
jgi:hypothetical protein